MCELGCCAAAPACTAGIGQVPRAQASQHLGQHFLGEVTQARHATSPFISTKGGVHIAGMAAMRIVLEHQGRERRVEAAAAGQLLQAGAQAASGHTMKGRGYLQ